MRAYQKRVIAEKLSFKLKLRNMHRFVNSVIFKELSVDEQEAIRTMIIIAKEYYNKLGDLIDEFEVKDN